SRVEHTQPVDITEKRHRRRAFVERIMRLRRNGLLRIALQTRNTLHVRWTASIRSCPSHVSFRVEGEMLMIVRDLDAGVDPPVVAWYCLMRFAYPLQPCTAAVGSSRPFSAVRLHRAALSLLGVKRSCASLLSRLQPAMKLCMTDSQKVRHSAISRTNRRKRLARPEKNRPCKRANSVVGEALRHAGIARRA
ncbi:hypothetical protein J2793_007490, partial [Paraburkholderia caledonica]|nr:hypothetical protein [Paraburkholderia caledonica]